MTHTTFWGAERPTLTLHRAVLLPLLGIDLALIATHLASVAWPALLAAGRWSVEADGGVAELFQYLKWGLLGACFAATAWCRRNPAYLAWALVFAYLLADDGLQLHERAGVFLAARIDMPWLHYLRPRDVGELISTAAVASVLLLGVAAAWRLGGADVRRTTLDMAVLLLALAGFGVGLDALHSAVLHLPVLSATLGTVEDGGEMLVASLMLAYAVALWRRADRPAYADALMARLRRRR